MKDFEKLFKQFTNLQVAIVGDVMLDTYWWGHADRISPEAPVPIVAVNKKDYRLGGAGNVALNTVALGAQTNLFSVIGNDDDGDFLQNLFIKQNMGCTHIIKSSHRLTTNKIRIMSRNQQMMRLDSEMTSEIKSEDEESLLNTFRNFVETSRPDVVVMQDYNKGVLTERVIQEVIAICKLHNIIITVDPKRKNFFSYKGVTIFKPNLAEVKTGLNLHPDDVTEQSLRQMHQKLAEVLGHEISLITLSEKGVFYQQDELAHIIPSHVRNIADVSGAGDTVIAVASLAYAATKDIQFSGAMANIAGGLVCEEVGTVTINKDKLLAECMELL